MAKTITEAFLFKNNPHAPIDGTNHVVITLSNTEKHNMRVYEYGNDTAINLELKLDDIKRLKAMIDEAYDKALTDPDFNKNVKDKPVKKSSTGFPNGDKAH